MKKLWKENRGFIIAMVILGFIFFNMKARTFVMQQLFKIGLFAPSLEEEYVIETPAENLIFRDSNGKIISLKELRGKVIFISFWATWCPPCIAEMPSIQKLYHETEKDDVKFILADVDNEMEKSHAFMSSNGYTLPVFSIASSIPKSIFNGTLPTTVILDKTGKIIYRQEGIADYGNTRFTKKIKELAQHNY